MPSPVAHALAGLASGWIVRGNRLSSPSGIGLREAALFAGLGMFPDIDLLLGIHREATHSIGASVAAGLAAWLPGVRPRVTADRLHLSLACGLAYGSHVLLDWLGSDTSPPIGVMALWPFTREYYESGFHVFLAVSRRIRQPELFWPQNIAAFTRELMLLVPLVFLVGWIRRVDSRLLRVAQQPEHQREQGKRYRG